jgi:hypothetical protein
MENERVDMADLGAELEKALAEDSEEQTEEQTETVEQIETVPSKIMFKGQEKTVGEIEKAWDDMHGDYTVKTQNAAETKRQAEDMLRNAEAYYRAAQEVATQRAPEPEVDDEPYVTGAKLEKTLSKVLQPFVQRQDAQDKALKEMALNKAIQEVIAKYPKADEEEILWKGIAQVRASGSVNLEEIARQSHAKNSMVSTQVTPEMEDAIFKKKLAEYKEQKGKVTITPDSGKAPPMEPEKLKFDETKNYLQRQIEAEFARRR